MNWRKLTSVLLTSVIFILPVSVVDAESINTSGGVAYQPKPCKNSAKTDLIEIEEFKPTATVDKKPEERKIPGRLRPHANKTASEREKERTITACKDLKKKYHRNLRQAKATDKSRYEGQKAQEQRRSEINQRAGRKYKNNPRDYRRYVKKHKKFLTGKVEKYGKTQQQDYVKKEYRKDKKRLGCDKLQGY